MFDEQIKTGFVTIIGRPNAGKSTLLNDILKQKIAIMSDKPQTTRNIIRILIHKSYLLILLVFINLNIN